MALVSREAFLVDGFSSSEFIGQRIGVPLETLRSDLLTILKDLKAELIDLINRDYIDFISLSTNLVGLDSYLDSLKSPLVDLQGQMTTCRDELQALIDLINHKLSNRKKIKDQKASVQLLISTHECIARIEKLVGIGKDGYYDGKKTAVDEKTLERAAVEYNQLVFMTGKIKDMKIDDINETFALLLEESFRNSLLNALGSVVAQSALESLCSVLRVYVLLDKTSQAEALFTDIIAGPSIDQIFASPSSSLAKVYQSFLDVLQEQSALLQASTKILSASNVDFYISYLSCFTSSLALKMPQIYNAGIPVSFRRNYMLTVGFLHDFEANSAVNVVKLRKSQAYNDFIKKWQIHVYYQIQNKEIMSALEKALELPAQTPQSESKESTSTVMFEAPSAASVKDQEKPSKVLIECVRRCWDEQVYLPTLLHKFFKTSLLLIEKYRIWLDALVSAKNDEARELEVFNELENVRTRVLEIVNERILKLLPSTVPQGLVIGAFESSLNPLVEKQEPIRSKIIKGIAERCAALNLTRTIPREYRGTRKEEPTSASPFLSSLFSPIDEFLSKSTNQLPVHCQESWKREIVRLVTENYVQLVKETLVNVRNIEESLKRLKKKKQEGTSDEDKIRKQILLDVLAYERLLKGAGEMGGYEQLLEAAKSDPS